MFSGFYTISSGILQQERAISVISNNLVNAETPGFRASRVVSTTFQQEYLARIESGNNEIVGSGAPIRIVDDVPVNFEAGPLQATDRPFDIAINGNGFFVIEDDEGEQYLTRNGNFDLDEEGYLVLRGIGRVMGESGEMYLGTSDFTVSNDGVIYLGSDIYDEVDRLILADPGEEEKIYPNKNGTYRIENMDDLPLMEEEYINVRQKNLEKTNMDLNQEYIQLMEAQRAFQACSTALQIMDKINQKAASQIASL